MGMINIYIPGNPIGKGRPKFARIGSGVRAYTDKKTAKYESVIAQEAMVAMAGKPILLEPVHVEIYCHCEIPKSWSKKKRNMALDCLIYPSKPDVDNVAKAILDGCNGVVWKDDVQVVSLVVNKIYSEIPRVNVAVCRIAH